MKKHNLLSTAFVLIFILSLSSCQKNADINVPNTIGYEKQDLAGRDESGDPICWQLRTARGFDIDSDPRTYTCYPRENICFMKWVRVKCKQTEIIADNEMSVFIEATESKLRIDFDLSTASDIAKEKFFTGNKFIIDEDVFFPEELTKDLGLETPYLIQKGEYELIGSLEDDQVVSVLL